MLTEFHLAVLSMVIFAPCFEPVSPEFLYEGLKLTYLETAPGVNNEYVFSKNRV
jgi:hypothetical protein